MPGPITLTSPGNPLYLQVLNFLATDTDPAAGLVPALGQRTPDGGGAASGVYSLYPNFYTGGPSERREVCPLPFIIAYGGGARALDRHGRELRLHLEAHDDPNYGIQRLPGLLARLKDRLLVHEWRPTSDQAYRYLTGVYYESESPLPPLPDDRYRTVMVQLTLCVKALDRTSGRGYNG